MFKRTALTSLSNYKTTAAGVLALVGIITKIASTGHVDLYTDGAAISAAIGLIVAHDGKSTS